MEYGAAVETGKLKEKVGEKWRVESCSRAGITTPPLRVLPLQAEITERYAAGDRVFFALMPDGSGLVLCKME